MSVKTFVIGAGLATGGMLLITAVKPSMLEHVSQQTPKAEVHLNLSRTEQGVPLTFQIEYQNHSFTRPLRPHS